MKWMFTGNIFLLYKDNRKAKFPLILEFDFKQTNLILVRQFDCEITVWFLDAQYKYLSRENQIAFSVYFYTSHARLKSIYTF